MNENTAIESHLICQRKLCTWIAVTSLTALKASKKMVRNHTWNPHTINTDKYPANGRDLTHRVNYFTVTL